MSGRPPKLNSITFLIVYRQLPTLKQKPLNSQLSSQILKTSENSQLSSSEILETLENSQLFYWNFWEIRNLKLPQIFCLLEKGNFYIFGKETTIQRNSKIPSIGRGFDRCQKTISCKLIFIIWNKTKCWYLKLLTLVEYNSPD